MTTPKLMEEQDSQVNVRPHEASAPAPVPSSDEGWMTRQDICAKLGVSVRTLRRLRKQEKLERRIDGCQAFYRLVPGSNEETAEPDDTEKAWLDVVPIRTGRRAEKTEPTNKPKTAPDSPIDAGRLTGLLRLALDQRDQSRQARDESNKRQEETQERLDNLQSKLEEVIEQRNEARRAHKRVQVEREELTAKVSRLMNQRDDSMVARAEAEHQRDELACELNLAEVERDMLAKRRDELIARLDQTVRQREYAQRQLQQAHQLLTEWQDWRDQAEDTLRRADERTVEALKLAADAINTPWWGVGRRRALHDDLQVLLRG